MCLYNSLPYPFPVTFKSGCNCKVLSVIFSITTLPITFLFSSNTSYFSKYFKAFFGKYGSLYSSFLPKETLKL